MFLYSEFFKCKSYTWENRNISLPVFHKRKSCYLKKTTPIGRVHWLTKSRVKRKQLKSLLSPWSSSTVRLLGCLPYLCHEVGPQADPHQAWDHHLQDHMNQDYSKYPARKERWDTPYFTYPTVTESFVTFLLCTHPVLPAASSPQQWRSALPETIHTNTKHHLRYYDMVTVLDETKGDWNMMSMEYSKDFFYSSISCLLCSWKHFEIELLCLLGIQKQLCEEMMSNLIFSGLILSWNHWKKVRGNLCYLDFLGQRSFKHNIMGTKLCFFSPFRLWFI